MRWRPPLTTTLDRYVLRRFLLLYAGNLVCFTLVYVLVDTFENLGDFADRTETLGELLGFLARFYSAFLPVVFCQLLGPVVALTSGLFTVTLLHRANELVPMLANGRPYWRIFLPVFLAGGAISAGTFLVQELWIPRTADIVREVQVRRKGRSTLENRHYLDRKEGILVFMGLYHVVGKRAENVTVLPISNRPTEDEFYIRAAAMHWVEPALETKGHWLLQGGQIQRYNSKGRLVPPPDTGTEKAPSPPYERFVELPLRTSLIPEDVEALKEDVAYMDLPSLRRKIRESADRRWTVKYFSRFATPVAALVLLLVGLPVITYYGSRNVFFGAMVSAVVATVYFVASSLAGNLGLKGYVPASLGAWLGPLTFAAFGVTWLKGLRT